MVQYRQTANSVDWGVNSVIHGGASSELNIHNICKKFLIIYLPGKNLYTGSFRLADRVF